VTPDQNPAEPTQIVEHRVGKTGLTWPNSNPAAIGSHPPDLAARPNANLDAGHLENSITPPLTSTDTDEARCAATRGT
jgi:hypothetical protein